MQEEIAELVAESLRRESQAQGQTNRFLNTLHDICKRSALTAVEATILKAAGSADVTVSFGDFNLSFETRRELMAFREDAVKRGRRRNAV